MRLTKKTMIAIVIAIVALLAVGGATLAFAAPDVLNGRAWLPGGWPFGNPGWGAGGFGLGKGGAVTGIVKSVNDSQLVVTVPNSTTVTVTVTSQTTILLMPARTAGKVTDIKVGDTVQVKGKANTSGGLDAQTILVGPVEVRALGQVTAVNGANITIQLGQKTQTVVTDANTKFTLTGGAAGKLSDVKTGDFVAVMGQLQGDGTLLASQVNVGTQPGLGLGRGKMDDLFGDGNKVAGQVTAVDGSKITIQVGKPTTQTVTIVTDANTKFTLAGGAAGKLSDVKTGEFLVALVQKQADGSLLASQIMVGTNAGFGPGHGMGVGPMWNWGQPQRQGPKVGPGNKVRPVSPGTDS